MFINPAIIGLTLCTIIVTIFLLYACLIGIQILRFWDISSGEEQQLLLEKKTYLISSILYYVMACEIFSLFLFVFIAEDGHELFIGAMCAAGTLNVNDYGYPTLLVRLISFILCGVWIVINYIDNNGHDYPLIKFKQIFLFGITLVIIFEGFLQFNYLLRLEPEIITSCCGTIFSDETSNVAGEIIRLPVLQTEIIFYLVTILTVLTGAYFLYTGKQALLFSCLSFALLIVGLTAILSFIAVYYYEEPTHHCPFCLLKKEYFYIGYALYATLFTASIAGISVGVIHAFRNITSVEKIVPKTQRALCFIAIINYLTFAAIGTWPFIFSDFKLV